MCPSQHRLRLVINKPLVTDLKQRAKWTMKIVAPFPAKLFIGGYRQGKKEVGNGGWACSVITVLLNCQALSTCVLSEGWEEQIWISCLCVGSSSGLRGIEAASARVNLTYNPCTHCILTYWVTTWSLSPFHSPATSRWPVKTSGPLKPRHYQ